ncbi:helix-turn-helix transcriptional regulator [Micromonospora sp. 067-2]|uniref:helix-turn-helix transcriptional regulator n=1 Tax=Micromonospora sp. 067-2 TaxID=2789270 RepID=UPI00397B15C2
MEVRRLLAASQQQLLVTQRRIIEHHVLLERLERGHVTDWDGASVGVEPVSDPDELRRMARDLVAEAGEGCRSIHAELDVLARVNGELPVRPPSGRTLCARTLLEDHSYREVAEHSGARLRVLPAAPLSLLLANGRALLPARGPDHEQHGLLIRHPALIELLIHWFDALWRQALPLRTGPRPMTDGPSDLQLQILRLAALGMKDESIARSLGRSTRWVRRQFEILEERLGATNRITLGIAAVRRSWI